MGSVIRGWIVDQLFFGGFASYRDICRKAVWVACKVALVAYGLNLGAHFLLYAFDLLPYGLGSALIIATVLTPPITFILAVLAYVPVGFAIHDLGVSRAEFERLSRTDMLSGLANRRAFLDQFDRCDQDKAMLVLDLDQFKFINDTYGHLAGDAVIAKVGEALAKVFPDTCTCARIGGEEFAVFCRDMPFGEFAALGEIARRRIAGMRIEADDAGFSVTVSGGLARALPEEKFGEVFSRADKALYAAKTGGRDQIVLCYETGNIGDAKPVLRSRIA
ncbi:GGDEF domain-containing protein [Hoeflea sp.]|uniref:GGDEF domain-containing protein n=1 Tax=Hoeflea sp. TaxID=1940281 RepID=UPI003A92AFE3